MPYITPERREQVKTSGAQTPGELNYRITMLLEEYRAGKLDYSTINTLVGALECAKLELYRRVAAPYEDLKKEENSDVYA